MGFDGIYPLVNVDIPVERSTMLNGKTHDFNGQFSMAMLNYQRVMRLILHVVTAEPFNDEHVGNFDELWDAY